jgi:hypothetical protein
MIRAETDVSAAVAPAEGKMTALVLPGTTTAMLQLLRVHVSQTFQAYCMVMPVDQASWHQAKDLVVRDEYSADGAAGLQSRSQSGGTYLGGLTGKAVAQCGARHAR